MKSLKLIRKQRNKTQKDVADFLKMSEAGYSGYETGRTEPNIETLIKLADFFGCSIDYLLGHETKNIMHLDSLTEQQKRAFELVLQLDYDQTNILIGRLSEMLHLPYEQARPAQPF